MDYQSQIHTYPVVSPQRIQTYKLRKESQSLNYSSNTIELNKALQFFQTPYIHPKALNLDADVLIYCIWHVWRSRKVSENIYSHKTSFSCHETQLE